MATALRCRPKEGPHEGQFVVASDEQISFVGDRYGRHKSYPLG